MSSPLRQLYGGQGTITMRSRSQQFHKDLPAVVVLYLAGIDNLCLSSRVGHMSVLYSGAADVKSPIAGKSHALLLSSPGLKRVEPRQSELTCAPGQETKLILPARGHRLVALSTWR